MTLTPVPPVDGWWDSANRIAGYAANTYRGPHYLTREERFDAALDAIVQHVHEHGWPRINLHPVFQAASNAIDRDTNRRAAHLTHGNFWVEPPGQHDALAEAITDRIGIWQLAWSFNDTEWQCIWALSEVMKHGGDYRDAAALIGKTPSVVASHLHAARKKARARWVAPGDTPPGRYGADRERTTSTSKDWRKQRRHQNRKRARQAA